MRFFAILLVCLLLLGACARQPDQAPAKAAQESQKEEGYRKELDEIRKNIKGDIRIKLKRDGKGDSYSWEISGKDAAEVLKANDILAKKLGK
jgi:outer membrane biogenesis lipoprotein LolB